MLHLHLPRHQPLQPVQEMFAGLFTGAIPHLVPREGGSHTIGLRPHGKDEHPAMDDPIQDQPRNVDRKPLALHRHHPRNFGKGTRTMHQQWRCHIADPYTIPFAQDRCRIDMRFEQGVLGTQFRSVSHQQGLHVDPCTAVDDTTAIGLRKRVEHRIHRSIHAHEPFRFLFPGP